METKILKGKKAIIEGSKLIIEGDVVAFPTETVYGLGASIENEEAIAKIFTVKGRPQDNPLIVHIARQADVIKVCQFVPEVFWRIYKAFMPGPITVIMEKNQSISSTLTAGLDTVGIRFPKNKVAVKLIKACNVPICAPSANLSQRVSPTLASHVLEDFNGKIPLIIDGGKANVGIESTIVDITTPIPTILRPGRITDKMLAKVIGRVINNNGNVVEVAKAPGMKYKHYSPTVELFISSDIGKVKSFFVECESQNKKCVYIGKNQTINSFKKCFKKENLKFNYCTLGNSEKQVAKNIFKALRSSEKIFDFILCENFGEEGIYKSVMNRIYKSAGEKML